MSEPYEQYIIGLDIGTSKVLALVGGLDKQGRIKILATGLAPSAGLERGDVIDIDAVRDCIRTAIANAEHMLDVEIQSAYISISGLHISGINSTGQVSIRSGEVTDDDVERVMENASSYHLGKDHTMLHVLSQGFCLDQQRGIKKPVGMAGVRMEVQVHLVISGMGAMHNLQKSVARAGLTVDGVVLAQLASSYAVLTEDEKNLGVCVVDIGAGTTDIAVFTNGALRFITVVGLAGNSVTRDISTMLHTDNIVSEDIKRQYGCAYDASIEDDQDIYIPTIGEEQPMRSNVRTLAAIIEPRYREIFCAIREELSKNNLLTELAAGVVLTGGSANIKGVRELAKEVFEMPVRIGKPIRVDALKEEDVIPEYTTAVGLLMYGAKEHAEVRHEVAHKTPKQPQNHFFKRVKQWYADTF